MRISNQAPNSSVRPAKVWEVKPRLAEEITAPARAVWSPNKAKPITLRCNHIGWDDMEIVAIQNIGRIFGNAEYYCEECGQWMKAKRVRKTTATVQLELPDEPPF